MVPLVLYIGTAVCNSRTVCLLKTFLELTKAVSATRNASARGHERVFASLSVYSSARDINYGAGLLN